MGNINQSYLRWIRDNHLEGLLFRGIFGIEKEHVRVTEEGKLTLTPHPHALGDKYTHPYITTDFSESQVEIITPPLEGVEAAYSMLQNLHNIVTLNIGDEYLWPQSTPPILPDEKDIPIAEFGDSQDRRLQKEYREELAKRYGKKKQMISGIHLNFSFPDPLLQTLFQQFGSGESFVEFRTNLYLKLMRHTIRYSWLLIKLFGSSPVFHESYSRYCKAKKSGTSIRNGRCGYGNKRDIYIPMHNLDEYISEVRKLVAQSELTSHKELYTLIRPKNRCGDFNRLLETGIEYVELRLIDINPLFPFGISKEDLYFIHSFFLLMVLLDEEPMTEELYYEEMKNNRSVADYGRDESSEIMIQGVTHATRSAALGVLEQLKGVASMSKDSHYQESVEAFIGRVEYPDQLYSHIIYEELGEDDFISYHMKKAREYRRVSESQGFHLIGYEDMELSTQILILDALRRGVSVEILDRHENFIRLSKGDTVEYVKQATKTSKDSYSTVLMMEHKGVTKRVLQDAGIGTPKGVSYTNIEEARGDYVQYKDEPIVIKPNGTNFGLGITIFTKPFLKEDYYKALDLAFQHDSTVLVETFIPGKEYRVFVIGDQVVGVLHRVPANVLGDGEHTIEELVEIKNQDPLRGTGYRKPLQKIILGPEKELFLSQYGMSKYTVPPKGETVYLTESSNISTGGDSIDMTDSISEKYKSIAVAAAKAMGATITGVDLMTTDITAEDKLEYAIIELNFNPAIHIHCYPFQGKNRHLGDKILDCLGF